MSHRDDSDASVTLPVACTPRPTPACREVAGGAQPDFKPMPLEPMEREPLVSVIISNYNGERFVEAAVRSVLAQTYQRFEIAVCDDGSTDGSAAVLDRLSALDQRVRVFHKENGGQASAWNLALAQASGEVICFLDPDDTFYPDKLREVVTAFAAHPGAGVCFNQLQPRHGTARPSPAIPRVMDEGWLGGSTLSRGVWGQWPPTSGISLRRPVADEIFPIPEYLKLGSNDAYVAGAAQFVTAFVAVYQPLGDYRLHDANVSSSRRPDARKLEYNILYQELPVQAWQSFLRRRYGDRVADQAQGQLGQGRRWYWENVLALYLLLGKPAQGVRGFAPETILAHADGTARRALWRTLLSLPAPVSGWLLSRWWGTHWWKYAMRSVLWRAAALKRGSVYRGAGTRVQGTSTMADDPRDTVSTGDNRDEVGSVTVLVTALNAGAWIAETIESVLAQTYADFELILIDDGSTDETRAVMERYAALDRRVRVISRENRGRVASLNEGLALAANNWIALVDADDVMVPERLERQVDFIRRHPDLAVASSFSIYIDTQGREVGRYATDLTDYATLDRYLRRHEVVGFHQSAVILRRDVVQRVGGYRPESFPAEDLDLWNRIVYSGYPVLVQPEYLLKVRLHGGSVSVTRARAQTQRIRWIEASVRRRAAGQPELSFADFMAGEESAPWPARLNRRRHETGTVLFKLARSRFSERKHTWGLVFASAATLLAPAYSAGRIWAKTIRR